MILDDRSEYRPKSLVAPDPFVKIVDEASDEVSIDIGVAKRRLS